MYVPTSVSETFLIDKLSFLFFYLSDSVALVLLFCCFLFFNSCPLNFQELEVVSFLTLVAEHIKVAVELFRATTALSTSEILGFRAITPDLRKR